MKSNPKLVSALVLFWLYAYTRFVFAAELLAPFSQDVKGFDFESCTVAMGAGLLGGAGRTIYSLASERIVVGNLWREGAKDATLALMGGAVAWFIVTLLANYFPAIMTREARMLAIVAAGASRGRWADWLGGFISSGLNAARDRMAGTIRGNNPPDATPSAVTPLNESK